MTTPLPTEPTPGQWCFKIVEAVDGRELQLKVRFLGDIAFLPVNSTIERWAELLVLTGSECGGGPIAVLFGEDNRIQDLGIIHVEEVREVSQNPRYPHVTDVRFEGMGLPKHLSKKLPRYGEMLQQITEAIATHPLIWCVLQGSTIVDIKVLSHEEDEILCRWMREHAQRTEVAQSEKR